MQPATHRFWNHFVIVLAITLAVIPFNLFAFRRIEGFEKPTANSCGDLAAAIQILQAQVAKNQCKVNANPNIQNLQRERGCNDEEAAAFCSGSSGNCVRQETVDDNTGAVTAVSYRCDR